VISPELFFAQTGLTDSLKEVRHVKKYILTFPYMKHLIERARNFDFRNIQWYKNLGLFNFNGEDIGLMISSPGAPMITTFEIACTVLAGLK
jgi:hypothetical protein